MERPSNEKIREILLNTPQYGWPDFDDMPLNCFDLTSATLTFPGDISPARTREPKRYAAYKIDIDDVQTCPRELEFFDYEFWNETSVSVPWFFGRLDWRCTISADAILLRYGTMYVGVAAERLRFIPDVTDLTDFDQLKPALFCSLTAHIENGEFQPIAEDTIYSKAINGRTWLVARSVDDMNCPTYKIVSPIDYQTVMVVHAGVNGGWFADEPVPEVVEQKYMASLWDFLGHIHLTHS